MTMKELYQIRDLRREIRIDKERLAEMETRATHVTQAMSGVQSGSRDGKKLEREAAAIADMRTLIEQKEARCQKQLAQLERYIQSIQDSLTRQIFTMRFEEGKTWRRIAVETRNSEENVRQICRRYVSNNS